MSEIAIRAKRVAQFPHADRIDICLFELIGAGIHPVQSLTFATEAAGTEVTETASLPLEKAQELFDDLWKAGLRPSGRQQNVEGVITAKDAHLADMRSTLQSLINVVSVVACPKTP